MGLSKETKEIAKQYDTLNDREKVEFLHRAYHIENCSHAEIAAAVGTYSVRIGRDARKYGIKARNKSQACLVAKEENRYKHTLPHRSEKKCYFSVREDRLRRGEKHRDKYMFERI